VAIGLSLGVGPKGGALAVVVAVAHRNFRPKAPRLPALWKKRVVERTQAKDNRAPDEDTAKQPAACALQFGMSE
jgi:hypothetical protein